MRVLLAIHYNLNNGDRAVLEATISLLMRKYGEKLDLTVSAFEPEKIDRSKIKVVPWGFYTTDSNQRRGLKLAAKTGSVSVFKMVASKIVKKEYFRAVQDADIVYISGGHHLTDMLGDDVFYSLTANIMVAEMINKPIVLLPQTIGNLIVPSKLKKSILNYILSKADAVAYRDLSSYEFLKRNNLWTEKCKQVPDVVYSIPKQNAVIASKRSIGVALYGNYSGESAKNKIEWYSSELAKALETLAEKGYDVHFIPMEIKGTSADDRWIAKKIMSQINDDVRSRFSIIEPKGESILETIRLFGEQDYIFAYKTHSVVFAMIQNIPLIAVAYHKKTIDFMLKASISDFSVMDKDASCSKLLELFDRVYSNYDEIRKKEREYIDIANSELMYFLASVK